jgi:hypothetical protein
VSITTAYGESSITLSFGKRGPNEIPDFTHINISNGLDKEYGTD